MTNRHKIILSNGTIIEAELNGNNFIFDTPVKDDVFTDETIKGMMIDNVTQSFDRVVHHFMEDGKDHVIFGNYTTEDILKQRVEDLELALASEIGGEVG